MAYRDLREFVKALEKAGELKRIKAEVDPVLEITEVAQRVARDKNRKLDSVGPALLFEKPKGSRYPLLVNTFGSVKRMAMAFEVEELDEVAARIRGFLDTKSPQGLFDKIKMLPKLAELGSFFPKSVKDGDCKQVIRKGSDVNLFDFPILKCWPQDGGRFITFPLVFTKNPETGKRNVGMYRMQVYDERTTGMHWQTQKHGAEHFRRAKEKNPEGRISVSVAIGADPATALAGMLPIPPDLDEMMFAGFLRKEPVEMVACETNELEVPANAEIVLEGYVNLSEMRTEGPFGDHTGFYSLEGEFPVFHVECVTHILHGLCGGACISTGDENAVSGNCGCGNASGRNFSQFDDCGDSKVISRARAENYECDLVAGAGDVYESNCCGGSRRGYSQLQRSTVEVALRTGPGARRAVFVWANGYVGSCVAFARLRIKDGD